FCAWIGPEIRVAKKRLLAPTILSDYMRPMKDASTMHLAPLEVQQRRVAALGRDVDADGLFGGVADQAVGAAGLGAGAAEALAAEGLDADDGADDRPVDIDVAGRDQTHDLVGEGL